MSKDNLLRAGVSLILSLLLWVYAVSDSNPMSTQSYSSIAIQYIGQDGLSANHLMLQSQITSVNITLYGRSQQLSKVKSSALYATADLSGITEEGTYTLQLQLNGIPGNITLSGISSEYITVDVIPIYEKTFDLSLDYSGTPSSGYAITGYTTTVGEVSITGNQDTVDRIAKVAGQIQVDGHSSDFTQSVPLKAYASDGSVLGNISILPSVADVNVSVKPTKTVNLKISTIGNCSDGYYLNSVTPNQTELTIAGDASVLKSIDSVSAQPIDLTGKNASFTQTLKIIVPDGITIVGSSNLSANVDIEAYAQATYTYDTVQIRNIPAGLNCDLSSFSKLTMTVQGSKEIISTISQDSITVYIDLDGLSKGTHTVPIQYTLPDGITVSSISMKQVSVTLQ